MLRLKPQGLAVVLCLCGIVVAQDGGIWLDVPFVQQEKNGCGAAVIAMVMQYWQKQQPRAHEASVSPVQIQQELYSTRARGIYSSDLERYFDEHGFRTFAVRGDWDMLRSHLQKGRPLIVALKPGKGETSLHYVVVAGIDQDNNLILLNDPAQKKLLKVERAAFEKDWKSVNRWTLLAVPK
jgi:ABC-type bacteriocin/lantibiotic exporter with double-glycine peptidase domain